MKGCMFMTSTKKYASERQRKYYEEVLPKLSKEIQKMDLGMRANTCLVSANILSLEQLQNAIKNNTHISMLDKEARDKICDCLKEVKS